MSQAKIAFRIVVALAAGIPFVAPVFGLGAPVEKTFTGTALAEAPASEPRMLARLHEKVSGGDLETMARDFLSRRTGELGFARADDEELSLRAIREGRAVDVVRFRQMAEGYPVYRSEIAVSFNHKGEVIHVSNDLHPILDLTDLSVRIGAGAARSAAIARLGISGRLNLDESQLVVFPGAERARLAWWIHLIPYGAPNGDWHVLVDAATGELLRTEDMAFDFDGSGSAFLPDPLSSAGATYGATGYTDGSDADTAQLTAEISIVPLRDLTFGVGVYSLAGPWADCRELEAPTVACPTKDDGIFPVIGRSSDDFEPENDYYHIDNFMRYINFTLGIPVTPYQYVGGVRFDPHGFNGADNSHYLSGTGVLAFGDGGVDDAEDPDVVIHELGHGLHDWLTAGGLSQVQGLSEGLGDYFGISYSRGFLGQWAPSDPQYNWMFSWDGHNEWWSGRLTTWNDNHLFPAGGSEIHTLGQYWASCNIDVAEVIGLQEADAAVIEGISMTSGSTNQPQAAQAVFDAAEALGYSGPTLAAFATVYNFNTGHGCNYAIDASIFKDGFQSGTMAQWSVAVP